MKKFYEMEPFIGTHEQIQFINTKVTQFNMRYSKQIISPGSLIALFAANFYLALNYSLEVALSAATLSIFLMCWARSNIHADVQEIIDIYSWVSKINLPPASPTLAQCIKHLIETIAPFMVDLQDIHRFLSTSCKELEGSQPEYADRDLSPLIRTYSLFSTPPQRESTEYGSFTYKYS